VPLGPLGLIRHPNLTLTAAGPGQARRRRAPPRRPSRLINSRRRRVSRAWRHRPGQALRARSGRWGEAGPGGGMKLKRRLRRWRGRA